MFSCTWLLPFFSAPKHGNCIGGGVTVYKELFQCLPTNSRWLVKKVVLGTSRVEGEFGGLSTIVSA